MRLGVLCDDPRAAGLWDRWQRSATPIEYVVVTPPPQAPTGAIPTPVAQLREHWEELLLERLDAVVVGGWSPAILEGARKFAQAGIPLWVLPHPQQGLQFAYELNLAAEETQAPLRAVFPERWHAGNLLTGTLSASLPGITAVEFVRCFPTEPGHGPPLMKAVLEAELLPDLDWLAWQFGRRERVTTLRLGVEGERLRQQTITLASDSHPELSWTAEAGSTSAARCTVHHATGATVFIQDDNGWRPQAALVTTTMPPIDPLRDSVPWSEAVTAFELWDAVEYSIERRRTIELHREPVSERAIFKTRMAAWGCGVLIGTLLLTIFYMGLASLVPTPASPRMQTLLGLLRALVFAPLFLFLGAQLLLPLTRAAGQTTRRSDAS